MGLLDQPWACEPGDVCLDTYQSPNANYINFDSIGSSFEVLFTVTTLEGWASILNYTQQITGRYTLVIFAALITMGNLVIANLLIAAIVMQLNHAVNAQSKSETKISVFISSQKHK